jgi:iron complex outermembrane receptor protein
VNKKYLCLLLASAAAIPGLSFAQDAKPADAPNSVDEIVVTAQRREERLLDVPVSVTVVSGEKVEAAGVVSTRDLQQVTPGFTNGQGGYNFQPSLRGITSTGTSAGDESNVALYVDGVYMFSMGANAFNLGKVDRIEVLKGPQGTLFGRNATGGAVRIVTADPGKDFEFNAKAKFGLDDVKSQEYSAYVAGPVNDQLSLSLSSYFYDDDGYLDNADPNYKGDRQGRLTSYNVRGKLVYQPADNLKITASADYGQARSGVEQTTTFLDNSSQFKNVAGVILTDDPWTVSTNEQNFLKTVAYGGYVNVTYDTDHFTFASTSALRTANLHFNLDNDRTNLALSRNVIANNADSFSQEFILTSNLDGPINFIGGLYYFRSQASHPYNSINSATIGPVVGGVRQITAPLSLRSSVRSNLQTEAYAAFGEVTWKITDQFSVTGGLRYNVEHKDALTRNLVAPNSPTLYSNGSWDNVSYRVTANYKPSEDQLVYFTTSTGFKSGFILSSSYTYPAPQPSVRPETVTGYEVGYKGRFAGWLTLTAAAYYYDYKDIQLTVNNALSAGAGNVGQTVLQNAARAKIMGAELELYGRFNRNWSGQIGLSYMPKAEYEEFQGGISYQVDPSGLGAILTASDLSGSRILRAPEKTLNAGLNYEQDLFGGNLSASVNYYYTDDFFLVVGEGSKQDSYSLVNGEVGWTDPSEHYTVSLWGRNLTNEAYYVSGFVNTGGFSATWAKPREVGVRLSVAF